MYRYGFRLFSILAVLKIILWNQVTSAAFPKTGALKVEIFAEIDGHKNRFRLDTGSAVSWINSKADWDAYKPVPGLMGWMKDVAGNSLLCPVIETQRISILDAHFENQNLIKCNPGKTGSDTIGLDLLNDRKIIFNLGRNELSFVKTSPHFLKPKPLKRIDGLPYLPLMLGEHELDGLFDTGANLSVVDTRLINNFPKLFQLKSNIVGRTSAGRPLPMSVYTLKEMQIGDYKFKNLEVAALNLPAGIPFIIGMNAIVQGKWFLDLQMNKWDHFGL